jgi:hypothetical protein
MGVLAHVAMPTSPWVRWLMLVVALCVVWYAGVIQELWARIGPRLRSKSTPAAMP